MRGRNLALTTFCFENCKLMVRQNTQRLRGCWVAKPPQMPPASPLTSRHHRGSRSHGHGHGGGHGHSDGHGFTSPGGRCCHRCSCSWCAVLLSTAAALQRKGGNEAQANGRERTGKLHDQNQVVVQVSKPDAVQASSLLNPNRSMDKISWALRLTLIAAMICSGVLMNL